MLQKFGVTPDVWSDRPALRYPTPLGIDRVKFVDGKKPKYLWAAKGGGAHPYGLEHALPLLLLQQEGERILYIVNGEPSVWACASRGRARDLPVRGGGYRPRRGRPRTAPGQTC